MVVMSAVKVCSRQGGLRGKLARQPRVFVVAQVRLDGRALRPRGASAHYTTPLTGILTARTVVHTVGGWLALYVTNNYTFSSLVVRNHR